MQSFLGQINFESLGVGLLKDSSLMGVFPLPTPTAQVSTLNMISTQVRQSFDSSHPLVVPGLDKHLSLSLSISLKNETNCPPLQSILTLDRVLKHFFLFLVKLFPLVTRNLKEERRRVVKGNDAWGEGLQSLEIMLEQNHQLLPKKLGENYL